MLAESYTIFKDNTGRANYRSTYRLRQQRGLTEQVVPTAPARPSGTSDVYRVGREVSAPVVTYREEPRYTDAAAKAKIDGAVLISLIVGENGVPRDLRIVRSLEPGLDQNASKAVSNWRFRPGEKDGKPVAVQSTIEIGFHILKSPRQ
jgi:TonB family protein